MTELATPENRLHRELYAEWWDRPESRRMTFTAWLCAEAAAQRAELAALRQERDALVAAIRDEHRGHWLQNRSLWRTAWEQTPPPIAECPMLACRSIVAALPEPVRARLAAPPQAQPEGRG